jgi:hypothetical protein
MKSALIIRELVKIYKVVPLLYVLCFMFNVINSPDERTVQTKRAKSPRERSPERRGRVLLSLGPQDEP